MNGHSILAEFTRRGITLRAEGGRLIAKPLSSVPPELLEAARQHKAELLALLTGNGRAEPPHEETAPLPPLLATIVDAIADAPRSPIFDDLAVARAAQSYVEGERAIGDTSDALRAEAASIATNAMNRVADAIRQARYQTAYELLDSLTTKMRGMKAH